MNEQDKKLQLKRLADFNRLQEAANELDDALVILQADVPPRHFTMNSSEVKKVLSIRVDFTEGSDLISLTKNNLGGHVIGNALRAIFTERRAAIWKEMEKI